MLLDPVKKLESLLTRMEDEYMNICYYAHVVGVLDDDIVNRLNILQHKMNRMVHIYKETIDEW